MYESFYGLEGKPFRLTPDFRFFFESQGHKRALAYLRYGLEQREGFIVITGGIGTGKSTLVELLFQMINTRQIVAAKVVTSQLDADDLLRMVCASFGLPHEQMSKAALLRSLETFFQRKAARNERVLLVIDEAQNVPRASLEELRMLSNIQAGGMAVLQTFLLGQEEFMDILQAPDMEQLRQRVIATYRLRPLSPEETPGYIEHRLRQVGWSGNPSFDAGAYEEIHARTEGVPRRLNTFCDRLMLYGFLEGLNALSRAHVVAVAEELSGEIGHSRQAEPRLRAIAGGGVGSDALREDVTERLAGLEERIDALEDALILDRARQRG